MRIVNEFEWHLPIIYSIKCLNVETFLREKYHQIVKNIEADRGSN